MYRGKLKQKQCIRSKFCRIAGGGEISCGEGWGGLWIWTDIKTVSNLLVIKVLSV
jgi:hypothetical protein